MKKSIVIVLLDDFADWEAAFLAPALRTGVMRGCEGRYNTVYAAPGGKSVRSLGGLTIRPDRDLAALPESCVGLILAGGMSWQKPEARQVVPLVSEALDRGLLVGAICNATLFLAAQGFLNSVRHTGNTSEMMKEWGGSHYTGERLYEERQAVRHGNIVTANGTGYLEFTRECLLCLEADTPENIQNSYIFNKQGFYKV